MLFQQILNGLTNGSLYALMAVGVTMVYKSLGMLNFAHWVSPSMYRCLWASSAPQVSASCWSA